MPTNGEWPLTWLLFEGTQNILLKVFQFYNRISLEIAYAKLFDARQKQKTTFLPMLYVEILFSSLPQFF